MKVFSFFVPLIMAVGLLGSPIVHASQEGATLLLVPREDGPVRIGMDVGNRFPTVLLSYRLLPNGTVSLYGWSGSEWVNVTAAAYEDGSFLPITLASAFVVEKKGRSVPESLIPSDAWCTLVYRIKTAEIRPLLHLLGRHYDFRYKDWKWFSDNYHLPLNRINPEGLNVAWYQKQPGSNFGGNADAGISDLQYLEVVRSPQMETMVEPEALQAPVATNEEQVVHSKESAVPAEEETATVDEGNPLTNEVPAAIILGADDAEEADVDEPSAESKNGNPKE